MEIMKIKTDCLWSIYKGKYQIWHTILREDHKIPNLSNLTTRSYYSNHPSGGKVNSNRFWIGFLLDQPKRTFVFRLTKNGFKYVREEISRKTK